MKFLSTFCQFVFIFLVDNTFSVLFLEISISSYVVMKKDQSGNRSQVYELGRRVRGRFTLFSLEFDEIPMILASDVYLLTRAGMIKPAPIKLGKSDLTSIQVT